MWPLALLVAGATGVVAGQLLDGSAVIVGLPILGPLARLGGTWGWLAEATLSLLVMGLMLVLVSVALRLAIRLEGPEDRIRASLETARELRELRWLAWAAFFVLTIGAVAVVIVDRQPGAVMPELVMLLALATLLARRTLLDGLPPFVDLLTGSPVRPLAAPVPATPLPGLALGGTPGPASVPPAGNGADELDGDWLLVLEPDAASPAEGPPAGDPVTLGPGSAAPGPPDPLAGPPGSTSAGGSGPGSGPALGEDLFGPYAPGGPAAPRMS